MVPALMMLPLYSLNFTSPVTYSWVDVDEGLDRFAKRGKPFSFVNDLRQLVAHILF